MNLDENYLKDLLKVEDQILLTVDEKVEWWC
jgi:hypothetical protein